MPYKKLEFHFFINHFVYGSALELANMIRNGMTCQ